MPLLLMTLNDKNWNDVETSTSNAQNKGLDSGVISSRVLDIKTTLLQLRCLENTKNTPSTKQTNSNSRN